MFRQFDRRRSVFVQLLVSLFLVFFVATLVMGVVNYFTVHSTLTDQTYDHTLETLRQTSRVIETVLDSTERMAVRLSQNRTVQSITLANWSRIADHYPSLRQVRGMLEDELASSPYIHSVFLVSPTNERILSISGILRFEDYADIALLEAARSNPATSMWVGPRTTRRIDGRAANVITLLMDVPVGRLANRGLLVVNLDERLFYDTVVRRNQRGQGSLAILNQDSIVLSIDDKSLLTERMTLAEIYPELDGIREGYALVRTGTGRDFVSIITSDYNLWKYVSATPYDKVVAPSRGVLLVSVGVSLLFLTLGLGLSFVVSRRFYRPVQSLIALVGAPATGLNKPPIETDPGERNDEFEVIYASVDTLLRENRQFQERYAATNAILREHFLIDLVLGRTKERADVLREAREFELDLEAREYVAIVLRIVPDTSDEPQFGKGPHQIRSRVYGIAAGVLNRYARGFVVDFGKTDVIIGVLTDSTGSVQVCRTIAGSVHDLIRADLGIGTIYGIGSTQPSYHGLSASYEHAILALEYALSSDSGSIVAMEDVTTDSQVHSVILDYRRRIEEMLQYFRKQEYDRCVASADELIGHMAADRQLGRLHVTMLLHELLTAFLSLLVSFDLDLGDVYGRDAHLYHDFALHRSPQEARDWMLDRMRLAAQHLGNRSSIRRRDFVTRIESFVADHSGESIGLNEAADHLNMNRQYFCSVFKTAFGTTFGDYLASHRIERAIKLLESTSSPVGEIATEVGFSSARSFIRTFRTAKGVTPAKYRISREMNPGGPEDMAPNRTSVTEVANTRL